MLSNYDFGKGIWILPSEGIYDRVLVYLGDLERSCQKFGPSYLYWVSAFYPLRSIISKPQNSLEVAAHDEPTGTAPFLAHRGLPSTIASMPWRSSVGLGSRFEGGVASNTPVEYETFNIDNVEYMCLFSWLNSRNLEMYQVFTTKKKMCVFCSSLSLRPSYPDHAPEVRFATKINLGITGITCFFRDDRGRFQCENCLLWKIAPLQIHYKSITNPRFLY